MIWDTARHLLAVRLGGVDEVLTITPALRGLSESLAGRRLTLLTTSAAAEVAALIPEVQEIVTHDPIWGSSPGSAGATDDRALIERLRALHADGAVIFTPAGHSALPAAMLCHLAGIPHRLGYNREHPHPLLTKWAPEGDAQPEERHEVRRHLDLVAAVGVRTGDERLSLRAPAEARRRVLRLLADQRVNLERTWVVIRAGAADGSAPFSPELFAQAARRLTHDHGWQVLFEGAAGERTLVQTIRSTMLAPSFSLAGRLSLAERAALLGLAPLLITVDPTSAQLAAAVGTPVVALYPPSPAFPSPWAVPTRVLRPAGRCPTCDTGANPARRPVCLHLVSPDAVVAAAGSLLQETAPPTAFGEVKRMREEG